MNRELVCPKCGERFIVDEGVFASIVSQVRDQHFHEELAERVAALHKQQESERELERIKSETKTNEALSKKEGEVKDLQSEIERLKSQLKESKNEQTVAVLKAEKRVGEDLNKKEQELVELRGKLQTEVVEVKSRLQTEVVELKSRLQTEVVELKGQLQTAKDQAALNEGRLKGDYAARETNLREEFAIKQKMLQEQVDYYKDLKAKQSTKMVGETLELHCQNMFNRYRANMYPNAEFHKDNEVAGGTKGDYIFRDFIDDVEYISIMFEMKNENDTTATKHKNADFYEKLHKDRCEKKCEYAVLVTMLEQDNEFFNEGITDVSYEYDKMFVVRPQHFMSVINMLAKAARNSAGIKKELALAKQQSIDVQNFEDELDAFKKGFSTNIERAHKNFEKVLDEIDKTIDHLVKVRDALRGTDNNLRLANDKAEGLTIKKLTKNNPSMKARFEEARALKELGGNIDPEKGAEI